MLTEAEIARIESLWVPDAWPDYTDGIYGAAGHRLPFSYYTERVRHLGLSGESLVEAGCGTGRWCFAFATRFDHVLGFDLNGPRAATALWLKERFKLDQLEFMEGNACNMPAGDESADVVYSNSLAVGWNPLEVILRECFRVLKPGGICYIGLNGPGYAYYMTKSPDPTMARLGRERIYNDLCQPLLMPLAPAISPEGPLNAAIRERLGEGKRAPEILRAIGAQPGQIAAAEAIENDIGTDFAEILISDLTAIASGRQREFSHAITGRGYDPEELCATARSVGFSRFEWAPDGCISLQPDGSILKCPPPGAPPLLGEFEGRIRVYEALVWKPGLC